MIDQVKDKLRILKDVVFREPEFIYKHYKCDFKRKTTEDLLIFMADGRVAHGGLFDRLKGLMSVYALAKAQGKRFAINFTDPFKLENFLQPNTYNWLLAPGELLDTYPAARPLVVYGEIHDVRRLLKERTGQIHYYYGYDILKQVNDKFYTCFEWGDLYRELFKPSERLVEYVKRYKVEIGSKYIAIHLRFLNLLGDRMEYAHNPTLPQEEQKILVDRCLAAIKAIHTRNENKNLRLLIASDSMNFLEAVKLEKPDAYIIPGTIKHIDTAVEPSDDENLKVFVDLYMISEAERVYNIKAHGMWASAFPEYSAVIGQKEFERVIL